MKKKVPLIRIRPMYLILYILLVAVALYCVIRPTNSADWSPDQAILPSAIIQGDIVTINNVRNFSYISENDYTSNYYSKTYDLNKIRSVDYIVEPFGDFSGAAHTFLSFGFEGGNYVAISVEIRKKKGQTFSPLKGLFKQYTLVYVVADERDVVKLRTNYRKDDVYVYPTRIDQDNARRLFLNMVERVNKLYNEPEFYNTITNTCTTNIVRHVNEIVPGKIPWSFKVLMPGYSDQLAYRLGIIDTDLPYDAIRDTFIINEKAIRYADDPHFPQKIRERSN